MFLIATCWAAVLNLLLLAVALAWTPAFWSGASHWLQGLPWRTFGTELGAVLQMHPAAAGAVWSLWLCVTVVLCVGALALYAALKLRKPLAAAPLPTPEVAAMFGQLFNSLEGLQGFGASDAPNPLPPSPGAVSASAYSVAATQPQPPVALGASLQEIDPELGSRYDALLRELWPAPSVRSAP
jgi:hypothetical protein